MSITSSLTEIPVDVTLEFGSLTSTLGDLNAFTKNDIVHLNEMSDAPVKLCLNERVIAYGTLHSHDDTGKIFLRLCEISAEGAV